jgi:hypothetical protein
MIYELYQALNCVPTSKSKHLFVELFINVSQKYEEE